MYEDGGSELASIFFRAKETGITTSLDMALPDPASPAGRADWGAILCSALPHADIFLPSIEEILFMLRPTTYEALRQEAGGPNVLPLVGAGLLSDLGRELLDLGAKIVALKLGDRGLYLRTADGSRLQGLGRAQPSDLAAWANRELWVPCFHVDVVGTAGSGDATIAGFLSAVLRDLSPEEAATAAVAVGACNVEAADTLSGLRTWDETWERVHGGWARHELAPDAPGWAFDDGHGLWAGPRGR